MESLGAIGVVGMLCQSLRYGEQLLEQYRSKNTDHVPNGDARGEVYKVQKAAAALVNEVIGAEYLASEPGEVLSGCVVVAAEALLHKLNSLNDGEPNGDVNAANGAASLKSTTLRDLEQRLQRCQSQLEDFLTSTDG